MKKQYQAIDMEIIRFVKNDIITESQPQGNDPIDIDKFEDDYED